MVLFSLGALEKVTTLHSRAAAWHPIMLMTRFRREHATLLVAISLVADVGALLFLAVWPKVGAPLCIALIVIYSTAGVGMHAKAGDAGCRCFCKFMNTTTRTGLVARNSLFLALPGPAFTVEAIQTDHGAKFGSLLGDPHLRRVVLRSPAVIGCSREPLTTYLTCRPQRKLRPKTAPAEISLVVSLV